LAEDGELVIGPVTVGRRCFVGMRSVLREGVVMEDDARLEDLSLLPSGAQIPASETWAGSPARRVANSSPMPALPPAPSAIRRAVLGTLYAAMVLLIPLILLCAVVPGLAILMHIDPIAHPLLYLAAAPLVCFRSCMGPAVRQCSLAWRWRSGWS